MAPKNELVWACGHRNQSRHPGLSSLAPKTLLKAFPNRMGTGGKGILFADNDYVGVTGWPNMKMILSGDGFLGLVPGNQEITMRSLDFWRCENGLIRENWVTVDILHVFDQLGVDVFERMREMTPTPIDRGRLPG